MQKLGYALSSEEHRPQALVHNARLAEAAGFEFALISDHYHPWIDRQGQSPFVWAVIGGIAQVTSRLRLGTGVTCPTMRIHPAIIAQATATAASMMPGRFFLGVGTGENLNEHILADRWPPPSVRLEMLEEAVEVMRKLWTGGMHSHHGKHYVVENARVYTLPDEAPPIYFAASHEDALELAGRVGDGLISLAPKRETIAAFEKAGGKRKPCYGQITVCWARSEDEAKRIAFEWWPNAAITGNLSQELPLPENFEQAAKMVTVDDVSESIVCGPEARRHVDGIREYFDSGYDHVYVHQVGPDQEGFFAFYEREVIPAFR
jgi:G6PDH family F420-dependent oxidoreductase